VQVFKKPGSDMVCGEEAWQVFHWSYKRHLEILVIAGTVKESEVITEHRNKIKGSPWSHCHC